MLDDRISLYARLGKGFTLLALGDADIGDVESAAATLGIPLAVLRLDASAARRRLYERALILVRPDHHVAWRGDAPPRDWRVPLRLATGHADR